MGACTTDLGKPAPLLIYVHFQFGIGALHVTAHHGAVAQFQLDPYGFRWRVVDNAPDAIAQSALRNDAEKPTDSD
jgi:hypothetical protein